MERTIGRITTLVDELSPASAPEDASSLNFCVSDGHHVVAARWRNSWWYRTMTHGERERETVWYYDSPETEAHWQQRDTQRGRERERERSERERD